MNFRRPRTRSRRNSLNFIINSEKWRNRGKRISRKDDDFLEEDSEDDIAQAGELKDWVEEFYVRKSVCVDKSDQDVEVKLNKKQTLILSTLVPDEILLIDNRIEEAVDVMKLLLELSQTHNSLECETWYYALAIDMILDCGFQIESPQEISRFAEYAISDGKAAGISRRRLVVGIWTYWLRVDVERKAKRFENEALNWCGNENDDGSLKTLLSALRLAEGMLESLAKKVDDLKKVVDLMELRSLADKELMRLEQDTKVLKAIGPRWLLLKANSLHLSARCNAAKATFTQALEEARKINNRLEESMILAALANSQLWIQSGKAGTFLDWMSGAVNARSSWQQIMYKINNTTRQ
ncbi:uncharacterized protein LOC123709424 isoform X8 [Pieris brassicae]|uniref:uncharacterized protein LOC123709424 isoform X8 n=1 Tax=Pieris brassicae TaxID=7116 RepID=UPI001E6600CD|nr:uncharacterized protein LOC123709424 isoform X8 [Pieris brassicae]